MNRQMRASPTTATAMRRIEVSVREASDNMMEDAPVLTSLTGFLERPKTTGVN